MHSHANIPVTGIPAAGQAPGVRRRRLVRDAAAGALLFSAGGADWLLTPREARAQGIPLKTLTPAEAQVLEAVGETLAVGAREQGIVNFVDQQCSIAPQDALLSLRMAGAPPPFIGFYRAALAEVDRQSQAQTGAAFQALTAPDQHAFIDRLRRAGFPDWKGPAQGTVYNVLRSDAVDVVYGTMAGSERLDVPYMPHIPPAERW